LFWVSFFFLPAYYCSDPAASKGDSGSKKKAKRVGGRKKSVAPRCVKCDAVMKGGMKFCNKCGSSQVDEKVEDAKKPVGVERAKGDSEEDHGEEEIVVIVEEEEEIVERKDVPAVPEPVFKKPEVPLNRRTPASHSQVIRVDDDGDEEEEDSDRAASPSTSRNSRTKRHLLKNAASKLENSPKRTVEIESSEEEDPLTPKQKSHGEGTTLVAEPKVSVRFRLFSVIKHFVCLKKGAELAEMAHFFEKHRLTRERLESSAALLLEKLKKLQKNPPDLADVIDSSEWEEYDVKNPLFPFLALSQEAHNLYLPRAIDVLKGCLCFVCFVCFVLFVFLCYFF
jgi:hypothetical protein